MNTKVNTIIAMSLMVTAAASASEQTGEETPSLALLEFLGEFEDNNGRWMDPAELDDAIAVDAHLQIRSPLDE